MARGSSSWFCELGHTHHASNGSNRCIQANTRATGNQRGEGERGRRKKEPRRGVVNGPPMPPAPILRHHEAFVLDPQRVVHVRQRLSTLAYTHTHTAKHPTRCGGPVFVSMHDFASVSTRVTPATATVPRALMVWRRCCCLPLNSVACTAVVVDLRPSHQRGACGAASLLCCCRCCAV